MPDSATFEIVLTSFDVVFTCGLVEKFENRLRLVEALFLLADFDLGLHADYDIQFSWLNNDRFDTVIKLFWVIDKNILLRPRRYIRSILKHLVILI